MTFSQVRHIEARKRNFEVEMLLNFYAFVSVILVSAVIVTGWIYLVLGSFMQLFMLSIGALVLWPLFVLIIHDAKDTIAIRLYSTKIQKATLQAHANREATLAKYPGLKMLQEEIADLYDELHRSPSSSIARGQISLVQKELEKVLEHTDEFGYQACLVNDLQEMLDKYNLSVDPNCYAKLRIAVVNYPVLMILDTEINQLVTDCNGPAHEYVQTRAQALHQEFVKLITRSYTLKGEFGISEFMLLKFNLLLLRLKAEKLKIDQEEVVAGQLKNLLGNPDQEIVAEI